MNHDRQLVFFDFDGVIADSFEAALAVVRLVEPDMNEEELREQFAGNVGRMIARVSAKMKGDFFDVYQEQIAAVPIFPGIEETVRELADDYLLAVVSSTRSDVIEAFLRLKQLRDSFTDVAGSDVGFNKAAKLQLLLNTHNRAAQQSVFITDTLGDLLEANRIGLQTVAVTWGYHGRERLLQGRPKRIVEQPAELAAAVRELL